MRGRDRRLETGSFPSTHTDTQVVLTLYLERLPSVARLGESSRTLGSLQEGQGDSEFRERKCKKKKKKACARLSLFSRGKKYQRNKKSEKRTVTLIGLTCSTAHI